LFVLFFLFLLAVVLSVLRFTDSDYPFGIFWPLCCLSYDLRILITPLVFFYQYVACPMIYRFWLPLWYILTILLSVLLRFTDFDYPFGIFGPLCCLSYDLQILITPLVSFDYSVVCPSSIYGFWLPLWYLLTIMLSVLWFTDSDYPFGVFWLFCCLSFFDLRILITSLVSFDHYVAYPMIYGFGLPLWYLLTIMLNVLWYTDSDWTFGIFWPLCCLSYDLRILITPLVSFDHYVVCPMIYGFWLSLWYLLTIMLSVLWFTDSDYPFGIFKLFFLYLIAVSSLLCKWVIESKSKSMIITLNIDIDLWISCFILLGYKVNGPIKYLIIIWI
jgi:hypothetical protein